MPDATGALSLFAQTAPGLERLVARELRALGMRGRAEDGGVAWRGGARDLYAANLHLRAAGRVLVRVGRFDARAFWELEKAAARLPWERFLPAHGRVALRVTSTRSRLYHERAIAERLAAVMQATGRPLSFGGVEEEDEEGEGREPGGEERAGEQRAGEERAG
ncbi:MAG TPA: THUMP domain-containing protein, partial [Longimicrobiales bacterium]|nr:THUMP domain-containing protein [Longimicrobiales bacterium]